MRLSEYTEQIELETEYEDGEPDECPKCQELNRVESSTEFVFCEGCRFSLVEIYGELE